MDKNDSQIVGEEKFAHLIEATRTYNATHAARNVALVYTLFRTGLTPSEIGGLMVKDFIDAESGEPLENSTLRAEVANNGKKRPVAWNDPELRTALISYLNERIKRRQLLRSGYTGLKVLQPDSMLFVARGGVGFQYRVTKLNGVQYRSCASLTNLFNKLMRHAEMHGYNTSSARRTFAYNTFRQYGDMKKVREYMGVTNMNMIRSVCAAA